MSDVVGPDRIIPAENLSTWERDGAVKLRVEEDAEFCPKPISVPTYFKNVVKANGSKEAMAVKRGGKWIKWTYDEYYRDVRCAARAFIRLGLEPYSAVAVYGFNAPEWTISALGAIHAGGFSCGLYPTNSPEVNKFIMEDSKAAVLVCEDDKAVDKMWAIHSEVDSLKKIVQFTGEPTKPGVISWAELMKMGAEEDDDELDSRLRGVAINQCACLIYTSGTTGNPKGVMLSHDNVTFTTECAIKFCEWRKHECIVISYLPLSHIAALLVDVFGTMGCAGIAYYADKSALKGSLLDTLKEVRPTQFFGVPRVWEKIAEGMQAKGRDAKGLQKKLGAAAKQAGLDKHVNGKSGGVAYSVLGQKVVYKKVRQALGLDRCASFYSGAAPLSPETAKYFLSLDIKILELYGMSESTGPQTMNVPAANRLYSVGTTMPACKSRLSEPSEAGEGEFCMWGRNVMMGYLNREDKTTEDLDPEGWLHSGDMATFDANKYAFITGRIKELLITAGGENVAPVPIEEAVKRELPCVANAILIGDKRKFLTCFLTLKTEVDRATDMPTGKLTREAADWCRSVGCDASEVDDLLRGPDPACMAAIQAGIDRANKSAVSNAARVQKWTVLPVDLSVPGGELGPTMKLKRFAFNKKYAHAVDNLYA